jgi:hypothetical protein
LKSLEGAADDRNTKSHAEFGPLQSNELLQIGRTLMNLHVRTLLLITVSVFYFCGCSIPTPYSQLNAFGAKELVDRETFEPIDLEKVLLSAAASGSQIPAATTSSSGSQSSEQDKINTAFRTFYNTGSTDSLELRRNRVQERILASSTQRCAAYTRFLKQFESEVGFTLGAITTALAGAGAIFTPATTVRALSGAAAITSGVNAEFSEKLFARLTIQVITKAIDARRGEIYKGIAEKQGKPIKEYPVEAAVKDTLYYHGACSLLSGLEEAAASIERASNPGLDDMNKFLDKFNTARDKMKIAADAAKEPAKDAVKDASKDSAKDTDKKPVK